MNTPQTRLITLSAMKATNTEHTAINGNHSKCRMTFFLRIDVQWLTIAVHKEMILETLILCFKQQMLVFTQQQLSVLFTWLRLTTYLLAHKEMPQPAVSEGEEQRQRKRHHNPHDNLQRQSNFYIVTERIVSCVHYESVGRGREW